MTEAAVFEVFAANVARLRDLVAGLIAALPAEQPDDACAHALDGLPLPFELPEASLRRPAGPAVL